jgi:rubrerythrin
MTEITEEMEQRFQEIAEEENAKIDAGEYECPNCGFRVGFINTVSCNQCGHIPEEHRWTGTEHNSAGSDAVEEGSEDGL